MYLLKNLLFSLFVILAPLAYGNPAREAALEKIAEVIDPNMAKLWDIFFSNFDEEKIVHWNFFEKTGAFSITLQAPLKLWIPASKSSSEPRPGSILILGLHNKVEGRLNKNKKSIEFSKGFQIYCKHKIGFFTVPILVDVYSFTYKNEDSIILEAGKAGISEKRSKPLQKYLTAWANPQDVVLGDYEAYLRTK